MKISAGIIITDGQNILLGHSTGNEYWDIPKGEVDDNETFIETAIRETYEEFGLIFREKDLKDLGVFSYLKKKNLYLFKIKMNKLPNIEECFCSSYFKTKKGYEIPEIDNFKIFSNKEGIKHLNKSMQKVFIEHNLL